MADTCNTSEIQPSPTATVEMMDHQNVLPCDNEYIYNVTQIVPIEYARIMYGVMMPFLVVVTIVANSLIIVVLSRRHMRTPTNLVLLWMATADLLTLLAPAPWYFYMYTLGYHQILPHGPTFCYVYNVMIEHFPIICHTTSIWLTILLAGQRYIYICHPTTAKTLCTVPKVNRAIVALCVASFSVQLSRFFDTHYESVQCQQPNIPNHLHTHNYHHNQPQTLQHLQPVIVSACVRKLAPWLTSPDIYFPLYYGFRILFVNLGPCIALVILNVLLFCALQKAQNKRKRLLKDQCKSKKKKRNDLSNSTTYMLIVVVSVFLMVEIPMAIVTIVHLLANLTVIQFEGDSHLHYINITVIVCNFIIMLSFPLNFAIYCGMSAQFRNTFKRLFGDQWCGGGGCGGGTNGQGRIGPDGQRMTNHGQPIENTITLAIVGDGTSVAPPINNNQNGNTFNVQS